jgi:hypothetical protein
MRLIVDVQVDDQVLADARDNGTYVDMLKKLAAELQEAVEHEWDTPDGWFRITYVGSSPAPKDLFRTGRTSS